MKTDNTTVPSQLVAVVHRDRSRLLTIVAKESLLQCLHESRDGALGQPAGFLFPALDDLRLNRHHQTHADRHAQQEGQNDSSDDDPLIQADSGSVSRHSQDQVLHAPCSDKRACHARRRQHSRGTAIWVIPRLSSVALSGFPSACLGALLGLWLGFVSRRRGCTNALFPHPQILTAL